MQRTCCKCKNSRYPFQLAYQNKNGYVCKSCQNVQLDAAMDRILQKLPSDPANYCLD